jgi:hypothetical protein
MEKGAKLMAEVAKDIDEMRIIQAACISIIEKIVPSFSSSASALVQAFAAFQASANAQNRTDLSNLYRAFCDHRAEKEVSPIVQGLHIAAQYFSQLAVRSLCACMCAVVVCVC